GATMLLLSAIGLLVPAIFHSVAGATAAREASLSFEIALVLIVTYILSLVFTLKTHRHLYSGSAGDEEVDHPTASVRRSVLVLLSYFIGPSPMNLIFTRLEVLSIALSVVIMAFISNDGETHWMEGVQLLAVYAMLGMAFFFLPG